MRDLCGFSALLVLKLCLKIPIRPRIPYIPHLLELRGALVLHELLGEMKTMTLSFVCSGSSSSRTSGGNEDDDTFICMLRVRLLLEANGNSCCDILTLISDTGYILGAAYIMTWHTMRETAVEDDLNTRKDLPRKNAVEDDLNTSLRTLGAIYCRD
ncbi:UNVERIFIED_CONTAM: hypothetical protein Sangu_1249600 [Sesamum angustifolium]|uniref:Uncharacterized protein n=1 Tax=Sesamum angustifolium TaxID=2727405 RepID=A0AAW2NHZ7_9LAMI